MSNKIVVDCLGESIRPLFAQLANDERVLREAAVEVKKSEAEEIRLKARVNALKRALDVLGPDF